MLVRFLRLAKYRSFVLQEQNHHYSSVAMKNPAHAERGSGLHVADGGSVTLSGDEQSLRGLASPYSCFHLPPSHKPSTQRGGAAGSVAVNSPCWIAPYA